MTRKDVRLDQADLYPNDTEPAVATTIARASESRQKNDDEKMHIFWRVFGGAIFSIIALVGITLFNNVHAAIAELRSLVVKLQDSRGDLVQKDEFNSRINNNYERISAVTAQQASQTTLLASIKTELDGQKERFSKLQSDQDGLRKESLSGLEAIKKDMASLDGLKEKLSAVGAEVKIIRDEVLKIRTDVDKNQIADNERKIFRDEQHKLLEKALKDVQAALQECQLKLARLEAQQPQAPAPKPKEPSKSKDKEPEKDKSSESPPE